MDTIFTDADDPNRDTLTYKILTANAQVEQTWLEVASDGKIKVKTAPDDAQVGDLSLFIQASDGSTMTNSKTFTLSVANTNDAPEASGTIATPDRVSVGAAQDREVVSATVIAGAFTDPDSATPDGEVLSYALSGVAPTGGAAAAVGLACD